MNEILDSQRPTFDKSGLGYNKAKKKSEVGTWSHETPKASSSMTKDESEALPRVAKKFKDQVCIKELVLHLQANQEEKQLQDGIQVQGMKIDSMAIVFFALIFWS